jgi:hypothetical protein
MTTGAIRIEYVLKRAINDALGERLKLWVEL